MDQNILQHSNHNEYDSSTIDQVPSVPDMKVGIPRVLSYYSYYPLWNTFFRVLGWETIVSGKSDSALKEMGIKSTRSEFCFPIKLSMAHVQDFQEKESDVIFYPTIISEEKQNNGMPRVFCPYVISFASLADDTYSLGKKILSPVIDFRQTGNKIVKQLQDAFRTFNVKPDKIERAYRKGMESMKTFHAQNASLGAQVFDEINEKGRTGIVFMGRPYNLYDRIINLGLVEKFREEDCITFPYELLLKHVQTNDEIEHIYWNYGEKILNAAREIQKRDNIYPVYFTNFSCGPDSFILSRFEKIMSGKPYLIIELDEHASETGYLTRIEAFMDVLRIDRRQKNARSVQEKFFRHKWRNRERKLWIPQMHEVSSRLFAAGFRAWGFDAEALPLENLDSFDIGRRAIRGSECLPACTTIGTFLHKMKELDADSRKHALFMPTAEGPCRFGQYSVLHRDILDRCGFADVDIFSPSSVNSYMGMPNSLRSYLWDIVISSDMLMKALCRVRPYERKPGETDSLFMQIMDEAERVIEAKGDITSESVRMISRIFDVPRKDVVKPLVGIVGEIYVRSNPFCNDRLIRRIETGGGEAWLSPLSEWILYTAWCEKYFTFCDSSNFFKQFFVHLKTEYLFKRMRTLEHGLEAFLKGRMEPEIGDILETGKEYLPLRFEGEAILTIGRTIKFLEGGAAMVVNCAPFGCMPGNITNSFFYKIQEDWKKPIVTLFYDRECDVNKTVDVYLGNILKGMNDDRKAMVKGM